MTETITKMIFLGNSLYIKLGLWSRNEIRYRYIDLIFDTGASVTTLSPEILYQLGYIHIPNKDAYIRTASSVERVKCFNVDKLKIGSIEISDVEVHAHKFPEESFAVGVIELNVLQQFDINLSFSERLIKFKQL